MHLLFDDKSRTCLGEVRVSRSGAVDFSPREGIDGYFLSAWDEWKKQGIEVLKSLTQVEEGNRITRFVFERIPTNAPDAFQAFAAGARLHGYFVFSLDDDRSRYWEEISAWPISDALRFELIFLIKNVSRVDAPEWGRAWNQLEKQVLA